MEQAWEAALRYEEYRKVARDRTLENIAILSGGLLKAQVMRVLRLGALTIADAEEARLFWKNPLFDWEKLIKDFSPYINRFEISVRVGGKLVGLAIGRPSEGPDNVTIHFLERCSVQNPLAGHIAMMVADAADNYAKLLGKSRLKIKNPSDLAIRRYEAIGFSLAEPIGSNSYYARKVE